MRAEHADSFKGLPSWRPVAGRRCPFSGQAQELSRKRTGSSEPGPGPAVGQGVTGSSSWPSPSIHQLYHQASYHHFSPTLIHQGPGFLRKGDFKIVFVTYEYTLLCSAGVTTDGWQYLSHTHTSGCLYFPCFTEKGLVDTPPCNCFCSFIVQKGLGCC